jgi:hypothetical protein
VDGTNWDTAIYVGTNDADDLLRYRLVSDFQHELIGSLRGATAGFQDLKGSAALPALDFRRSGVLKGTGACRDSDVMDGSEASRAGRLHVDGVIHERVRPRAPGSCECRECRRTQRPQRHLAGRAVLVDFGDPEMAGYFTAFTQQLVPTDNLGNPSGGSHKITDDDQGSVAG